jgi:hypothetical protein
LINYCLLNYIISLKCTNVFKLGNDIFDISNISEGCHSNHLIYKIYIITAIGNQNISRFVENQKLIYRIYLYQYDNKS